MPEREALRQLVKKYFSEGSDREINLVLDQLLSKLRYCTGPKVPAITLLSARIKPLPKYFSRFQRYFYHPLCVFINRLLCSQVWRKGVIGCMRYKRLLSVVVGVILAIMLGFNIIQEPTALSPVQARQAAVTIDQSLAGYRQISGVREFGDFVGRFTAYADKKKVVYIEERQELGAYGKAMAKYYFADGRLFYYQQQGELLVPGEAGSLERQPIQVSLAFGAKGQLTEGSLLIGGQPAQLANSYVEDATASAAELYRQASKLLKQ